MTTTYLLILLGCLVPLSKGLVTSKVPPMGYNSWYDLQGDLNETNLKETVDVLAKTFRSSGYVFFNLDDGWASDSRDKDTNRLVADPSRFTNGTLKTLADYAHSKNLKFGTGSFSPLSLSLSFPRSHTHTHTRYIY
jgi:alpha-galactosidase